MLVNNNRDTKKKLIFAFTTQTASINVSSDEVQFTIVFPIIIYKGSTRLSIVHKFLTKTSLQMVRNSDLWTEWCSARASEFNDCWHFFSSSGRIFNLMILLSRFNSYELNVTTFRWQNNYESLELNTTWHILKLHCAKANNQLDDSGKKMLLV